MVVADESSDGFSILYRPTTVENRQHIRYEVQGAVGVITIDRPEKRNAMTFSMLSDFIEAVAAGR